MLADQLANRREQIDALWAQQRQINIAPVRLHRWYATNWWNDYCADWYY